MPSILRIKQRPRHLARGSDSIVSRAALRFNDAGEMPRSLLDAQNARHGVLIHQHNVLLFPMALPNTFLL